MLIVLADRLKQFLLHIESYLVYEKEHEVGHCDRLYLQLVVFYVSTLKQALKSCKIFDFSVFAALSLAVAFKRRKVDYG